jgi:hypothetical protein
MRPCADNPLLISRRLQKEGALMSALVSIGQQLERSESQIGQQIGQQLQNRKCA